MSYEEIKVLESDLDDIESKTKEIIIYFENQIVDLVDKIENLQKVLDEKEKEINNLKEINKKVEGENVAFVNAVSHGRLQNIISGIELAMKNNLARLLNTNTITTESENNNIKQDEATDENTENSNQNMVDNNQNHDNSENNQNMVDNNQSHNNVENNHKIENSNASDIIDVDENEDPFSSASDDNWDKDISTDNSNTANNNDVGTIDDTVSVDDSYLEDEYVLNDDDTNDFLFDDEK